MRLRSSYIAALLAFFVITFSSSGTIYYFSLMETAIEQGEVQLNVPVKKTSGGGGSSSGGSNRKNPLEPIDVGEWGLYLPSQKLSFHVTQWVRSNGAGNLYFSEIKSNPEGIVDTWIDDGYIYIQAKELGKTTVTASVYSESGYTMSNSVNIEVKIEPNPLYPHPQKDIFINIGDIKGIHKNSWIGGFPDHRIWLGHVESNPLGVVDTWVDGDTFYVKGINPGETTVTAHVYTDYTFTMSNRVKVTVTGDVYGN